MALLPISELEQLSGIFCGKAGNAFAKFALDTLGISKVEEHYKTMENVPGPDGADIFLKSIRTSYSIIGQENLDKLPDGPFITVSNHPIGSLDGIILIDIMGHLRPDFKVMVNKILYRVASLRENFISVTPTGEERTAPTPDSISGIRAAMEHVRGGHPLGLFPSGAISDLIPGKCPVVTMPDGSEYTEPLTRDRDWQMPIVKFISKVGVPVVPVRFFDGNSRFFYLLGATLGWKVRLLRFPREVTNKGGKTIRVGIGPIITPEQQAACKDLEELRTLLRGSVYGQKP